MTVALRWSKPHYWPENKAFFCRWNVETGTQLVFLSNEQINKLALIEDADSNANYGLTECGICKVQMESGGTKKVLYPIKVLAASYGLLPIRYH
jgi:Fe-S oxidoreductase